MSGNALGEFLRARRGRLSPAELGLPSSGTRRVAGLRREEVAVATGINVDYYARLEQGRERAPSPQVVDALARALQLDAEAREHLHQLAGSVPPKPPRALPEPIGPRLTQLLDTGVNGPALLLDPRLDVVAANVLARALYSPFRRLDNLALMVFLDPAARQFHQPWERSAHATVANLRRASASDPEHPRLTALIETLTCGSREFAELWTSQEVRGKTRDAKRFQHPEVGPLTLDYQAFDVRERPELQLIVYLAEPGGPDAEALALLGTLYATQQHSPDHSP